MNSVAQQEYLDFGPALFTLPAGPTSLDTFNTYATSAAQTATGSAIQVQGCWWPVHYQGAVTQYVAELPAAAQNTLVAALQADPTVTKAPLGSATSFTYALPAPGELGGTTKVTYLFVGGIWIALYNQSGNGDYVSAALDGVLAANPSLAP